MKNFHCTKIAQRLVLITALIAAVLILLVTAGPYVFVVNAIPGQISLTDADRRELLDNAVDRVAQVSDQAKHNVLAQFADQDTGRFNDDRGNVVRQARIILANFCLNTNIEKNNERLQNLFAWRPSQPFRKTTPYDFAVTWMTTILYEFGENEEILYPRTREYLLNVLMNEDGRLDLKVPRAGRLFFDTENHLLGREGSRYLKNQWLKKHGNTSAEYDNDRNGLGDWLEKYLNYTRLHGMYEYNSTPYVIYSFLPLMNLADYADSTIIRKLAESILDNIALRFAYGSYNLKQCAPFRRQFGYAENESLYLNRFHSIVKFWMDENPYPAEIMTLSAVVHHYTMPVSTYDFLANRKDNDYYAIFGHDQKGVPEIYSGGKNYLLSAGGAYRGEFAKVISRPIALLLDDEAQKLSECIHIKGPGNWKQWNMTGIHRRFAVAKGSVFLPERYACKTMPGWNVVKANEDITVAFYQGRELAILIVLPDLKIPEGLLIQMLTESNPVPEESKQFNWPKEIAPENIKTIAFDIDTPADKWVITAVDRVLPENISTRVFEQWPPVKIEN
jgi:hypothetical protein